MTFIKIDDLKEIEPMTGFRGRFVHSDNVTVANWNILSGSIAPRHSHPHEQIALVIEGEFELTVGEEKQVLKPGITAVIPPDVIHSGVALTDCKIIDIFHPVREDYR